MANQWFRMYSEFATDAKVQMLSEAMQRRYLMLMCLRCSNALVTLQDEEIAFQLRIGDEELAETKALFIKKGFIDSDWNLLNWEKRQFASDSSKERVAKHRALQKQKQKQAGNDDVTLHETKANGLDTDTDTDKEEANASLSASPQQTASDEPDDGVPPCPFDSLIDSYEAALPVLPTVRRSLFAKGANGKALRARWRWVMTAKHERGERKGERLAITAEDGRAWFSRYFEYVADSDFLSGRNGKFQSCDLGWLVTAANFEKVLSGKYHHEQREAANA
jgi:hypothetical protein